MSCAVVACVVLCRPMPTPTRSRTTCGRPSTRRRGRGAGCRTASPSRPSWTPGQYKRDTRYSPSGRQLYTVLDSTKGIPGTVLEVDSAYFLGYLLTSVEGVRAKQADNECTPLISTLYSMDRMGWVILKNCSLIGVLLSCVLDPYSLNRIRIQPKFLFTLYVVFSWLQEGGGPGLEHQPGEVQPGDGAG